MSTQGKKQAGSLAADIQCDEVLEIHKFYTKYIEADIFEIREVKKGCQK